MTEAVVPSNVIVRGDLIGGHHDALIEILSGNNRRIGNHMILAIAEACLDKWPIIMADYTPAPAGAPAKMTVKITVRADLYPRLHKRYKEMAQGIRTMVFLNLLSRHAMLSKMQPQDVVAAMQELEAKKAGRHTEQAVALEPPKVVLPDLPVPAQPSVQPEPVAEPPLVRVDPLLEIHVGL